MTGRQLNYWIREKELSEPSVYKREIWNDAIEAAAKKLDEVYECGLAEDIRKLKK